MSVTVELSELDADLWEAFRRGGAWVAHSEYMKVVAENTKLREQVDAAHMSRLLTENENESLRELVRDMWRFTGAACKKYPRLFDPAAQGGQAVQLNMIDAFEQRMRELGVEE